MKRFLKIAELPNNEEVMDWTTHKGKIVIISNKNNIYILSKINEKYKLELVEAL